MEGEEEEFQEQVSTHTYLLLNKFVNLKGISRNYFSKNSVSKALVTFCVFFSHNFELSHLNEKLFC